MDKYQQLKKGCTGQSAINSWLIYKQIKHPQIIANHYNKTKVPIVWYNDGIYTKVECCPELLAVLRDKPDKYYYFLTCGLQTHNKMAFRRGHYYCVIFRPTTKQFMIINPHGAKEQNIRKDKHLISALENYLSKNGLYYTHYIEHRMVGPQIIYRYDRGYCGPWACLILHHIHKQQGQVHNAFLYINTKIHLGSHIDQIIKSISRVYTRKEPINGFRDKTVKFPTIKIFEADSIKPKNPKTNLSIRNIYRYRI